MAYQVFARKYRPQQFADVVAQEHVTRTLTNALSHDRVGSAYLFCGPRGTGKTTCARILAKAINCKNGPTPTPCGECTACKEITSGSSMDVLEIDAASNTGVDDIRTLRENVRYLPTNGKKRVYIIDEVHRLSGSAFDALLKTLEEPPPHVVFMFATTDPVKLPETILSRTQRFDFRRVTVDDLAGHLGKIAKAEKLNITPDALRLLARKADGSVRDSLSLLDQIAAFAGDSIDQQEVINALGLVDRQLLMTFLNAVAGSDKKGALTAAIAVVDGGVEGEDFLSELLEQFRILMVLGTDASLNETLGLTETELAESRAQSAKLSTGDLVRLIKITTDAIADIKAGIDERLILEVAAIRMASMEATVDLKELLRRLEHAPATEKQNLIATSTETKAPFKSATISRVAESPQTQPTSSALNPSSEITPGRIKAGWKDFLTTLKKEHSMLASQIQLGEVAGVVDNTLRILFAGNNRSAKEFVEKQEHLLLIAKALKETYNVAINLQCVLDEGRIDDGVDMFGQPVVRQKPDDLLANSPRLQKLVEKVNGEIIGVKKVE